MNRSPITAFFLGVFLVMAEQAPTAGQVSVVMGGSVIAGSLQTPYVYNCGDDPDAGALGTVPYAGIELRAFSLTAGYIQARKAGLGDCTVSEPPSNGVHRVREYRAHGTSIYGWAFHLRYAPGNLPLMAYAGAGYRFGGGELGGNRFLSFGGALRTPGRLSVLVGAEHTRLRTRFTDYDRVWQDGAVSSNTVIDQGVGWRHLNALRIGFEYRWRLIR
jgi:hypothetical protein